MVVRDALWRRWPLVLGLGLEPTNVVHGSSAVVDFFRNFLILRRGFQDSRKRLCNRLRKQRGSFSVPKHAYQNEVPWNAFLVLRIFSHKSLHR
jgi:hypothetical protein